MLRATKVVISTNIPLRRDGLPYAGQAQPNDPGVAVYFTTNDRTTCLACDRWKTVAENIYAIAKTIEALRGIERWGSKDAVGAAFLGFAALPPSSWRKVLGAREGERSPTSRSATASSRVKRTRTGAVRTNGWRR